MLRWNWHRPNRLLCRRLIVAVMLATYLAATTGMPVQARVDKPASVPFPCEHHACGCLTAEQCRENCCCFSAAERLAWAKKQGVEPPASWVAELAAELSTTRHDEQPQSDAPRACCAHHDAPACHDEHADHEHDATACDGASPSRIVFSITARMCRGVSSLWCLSGAVIVPLAVGWQFQWTALDWVSPRGEFCASRDLAPPVPPPRV
jgi:hypothetical protein